MRTLFPREMKAQTQPEASAAPDETAGITHPSAASYKNRGTLPEIVARTGMYEKYRGYSIRRKRAL